MADEQLRDIMIRMAAAACPASAHPGCTFTNAEASYYGYLLQPYLDEGALGISDDAVTLGKAFCAVVERNKGNRYATTFVEAVLKDFSGKEVSASTRAVLEELETFVKMMTTGLSKGGES